MNKHHPHDNRIKGTSVLKERLIGSAMIVSSVTLTGSLYLCAQPASAQASYQEQAALLLSNASSHASHAAEKLADQAQTGMQILAENQEAVRSRLSGGSASQDQMASADGPAAGDKAVAGAGDRTAAGPSASSAETATSAESADIAASAQQKSGSAKPYVVYLGADSDNKIMLDTCMGRIPYYNQNDSHWKNYRYGGTDKMAEYGCGPTALAMVVSALGKSKQGVKVSPVTIADWASGHGEFCHGSGSYLSIVQDCLTAYGLQTLPVSDTSADGINHMLQEGHILIALTGPGTFTDDGHFILITDRTSDGKVTIADPKSLENTQKSWDPAVLSSQLMDSHKNGAPLWAVSIP